MIQKFNSSAITQNGAKILSSVNGEILKIVVRTNKNIPNAKLTIKTNDDEVLCDDYLFKEVTRFYPKNTTGISQEQTYVENYFVFGSLFFEISGLGDNELIDNICVYYR